MKFIVAEKPSMMRLISEAIETTGIKMKRGTPFHEGDEYYISDEYCVTSCFGHLFTMCDPAEYDKKWEKWGIETLPFAPEDFKFRHKLKVNEAIKNRFDLICQLVRREDVECVINAGDADAEGQRIGDLSLGQAMRITKTQKPFYRLWVNDLTPKTVLNGLNNLKLNKEYKNYYLESAAREAFDFIFGINYTRFCSCKYGEVLHVGRVSGCIIKTIAERDKEINEFKSQKYNILESKEITKGKEFEFISSIYDTRKDCTNNELEFMAQKYNEIKARIVSVKKKDKSVVSSPRMFSMTSLQNYMSTNYKWSLDKTNACLQANYEASFCTYPRTPADSFRDEEFDYVQKIIDSVNENEKQEILKNKNDKRIYDSSRVTSHSCISITANIPDLSKLNENEALLYRVLYNRFCAVFCKEPCLASKIELEIQIGTYESWTKKGESVIQLGWQKYEQPEKKIGELPDFNEGEIINVNFKSVEKKTNPPKHLTVKSLNNFLETPFKKSNKGDDEDSSFEELSQEDMDLIKEGCEIGTTATREPLINQAISRGYFELQGQNYCITQKGYSFLEIITQLGIDVSAKTTAFMGRELMKVANGKREMNDFLEEETKKIDFTINSHKNIETIKAPKQSEKMANQNSVCKCPRCKGNIFESEKAYFCENDDFVLLKKSPITEFLNKTDTKFSKSFFVEICKAGKIKVNHIPSSKKKDSNGNPIYFDAYFTFEFEEGKKFPNFKMLPQNPQSFSICPRCKGNIYKNDYGWFCANNDFKMFKENKYFLLVTNRTMTDEDAKQLLEHNYLEVDVKNDKGITYKRKIIMSISDKVYPEFQLEKKDNSAAPLDYASMDEEQLSLYKVSSCRKCGGVVVKTNFGYQCMNKDFILYLDNYFTKNIKGSPFSEYEGNQLVTSGQTITTFYSKENKPYKAKVIMSFDNNKPDSPYPVFTKEYIKTTYVQEKNAYGAKTNSYNKTSGNTYGQKSDYNKKGNNE